MHRHVSVLNASLPMAINTTIVAVEPVTNVSKNCKKLLRSTVSKNNLFLMQLVQIKFIPGALEIIRLTSVYFLVLSTCGHNFICFDLGETQLSWKDPVFLSVCTVPFQKCIYGVTMPWSDNWNG